MFGCRAVVKVQLANMSPRQGLYKEEDEDP